MVSEWRKPPIWAVGAGLFLMALGASAGASLVFQGWFYDFARQRVVERPQVHGLTGITAVDEPRITEVVEQSNRSFRMLHVHGLGVGLLILVASTAVAQLTAPDPLRTWLTVLVTLGALYPPGWLLFGALIPFYGFALLRAPIEYGIFLPFGGAAIVGLWGTAASYLVRTFSPGAASSAA
jgi:hypothetical protein